MMMMSDDEPGTPPDTPPRSRRNSKKKKDRRRSPSPSSSSEEVVPKKMRKRVKELSAKDILKLVKHVSRGPSKNSWNYNNLNNVIPEFDPSSKIQNIESWLRKVNECAAIYGWDEQQTVHFSLQKLAGLAKRWFEALPTVVFTWEEWQVKLRKAFPSEENYGRLLEEMLSRTSRFDESLREYFYDKLGLLNRCEISGRKAVDCIIYGISDRSIRNGAQAQNSSEPEDLLCFLASQKVQPPLKSRINERTTQRPSSINPNTNFNSTNSNSNGTSVNSFSCYNCRARGHPFYKCPRPIIKCRKCNRIGHDFEACKLEPRASPNLKSNQAESTAEKNILKIDSNNDSNAKFFKTVVINDKSFKAFIDFGSECTLLRSTDAEQLNVVKSFDNVPVVKGFGQSSVVPLYKTNLFVRVDEIESDLEVLVIDDVHMQTSLIIGQNFTELPFITVLKDSSNLTFYKSPNLAFSEDSKGTLKLYITNTIEVSKTSTVPVHSNCSFTGDVFIEGYNSVETGKEFCLLQGAFSITNGKGAVVITNLTPYTISLKPNVLIARATPFSEQKVCHVNRIVKDLSTVNPLNKNEIKTGPGLDSEQLDRLYLLLQDYRDCFATNLSEIGCAIDVEMKIDLADDKPIFYRPYRLSYHEREQVRATIDELLQNDIIQESKSDYASPILMIKKKTGEQRLCVDFRALNNKTIKDCFPLPLIEDQLSNLSGNSFFTTLDLASGYYQIPMAQESQHLTGFVTPDGHYEFKRMPFGLANAPAVFQRMKDSVWRWSNTEDQAFSTLKDRLISRPVLALYDPTLETELHTDASALGIGVACPRANGQAERFNQTILNSLSAQNFASHERDWDKCLSKIQWGINNTVNASTQKTATEAMFGIKLRDVLSNKLNTENYSSNNLELQQVREQISNNIQKNQVKQKEKHDVDRIPATKYEIGDLVKISRNNFDNKKKSTKLLSKFVGPYKVTEVLGNDRYRITDVPGFIKKGKPYKTVIAADRIRPWIHIKALELHSSDQSSSDDAGKSESE
ncbi:uncharacterized protein [Maniola hyperantus]|uniref:uncharacterized protein n=1 Tax=Aphantopus hyperantus TaxID=2795564 RepID=UPI003748F4A3